MSASPASSAPARQRGLPAQPGYPAFLLAATLARLASEMFPVAAVLLVLDRTGRPGLAGAVVAATTLPAVVTGPVLGAWLDRTGRRRVALATNQVLLAASLLGILAAAGRAPGWTLLVLAALAGLTGPLATGGYTSMIPLLVPERLLARANALEASSFNTAAIAGPAVAGARSRPPPARPGRCWPRRSWPAWPCRPSPACPAWPPRPATTRPRWPPPSARGSGTWPAPRCCVG